MKNTKVCSRSVLQFGKFDNLGNRTRWERAFPKGLFNLEKLELRKCRTSLNLAKLMN